MKVELKGNQLVITIDAVTKNLPPPAEGKKMSPVASTGGFVGTGIQVDGKELKVSLYAGIKP